MEPKTIDMQTHTVTVTDVSDVDFVGGAGFMLGTNKVNVLSCVQFR